MILVPYSKIVPYSALYIDMTYTYLAKTMWSFFKSEDRSLLIKQVNNYQTANERLIVSACVRTSTDLLFQALNWPRGSEMILTGVNIPHMVQVVRYSGIIPVPVEVDQATLGVKLADIQKMYNSNTKGIMISYIYGAKFDATEIIEWCHSKGIFIFEDQAESFDNPSIKIHPKVDFATFSFGTIKTCSAFGGSISIIRNNEVLYRKMLAIQDAYPYLSKGFYFQRMLKNLIPMFLLNHPNMNQFSRFVMINFMRFDYKEKVVDSIRGFKVQDDFLKTFRLQVPTPMLAMLALRLSTFDSQNFNSATNRLLAGQQILEQSGVQVPGAAIKNRRFWLYPILVPNPQLTYKMLNARGVDAYMGVTQLDIVESPVGSKYEYPNNTLKYFQQVYLCMLCQMIYLPLHQGVPLDQVKKICNEVVDVVSIIKRLEKVRPSL